MASPLETPPAAAAEPPEPYRRYHRLRAESPVWPDPVSGRVVVTRYADVLTALKHPGLSMSRIVAPLLKMPAWLQPVVRPAAGTLSRMMFFTDPPDHTRLRGLANRAFTPGAVEAMRPRIEAITEHLLDRLDTRRPVDLMDGLANWLPITVIAEMLGVQVKNRRQFKRWSDDFALLISQSQRPATSVAFRGTTAVIRLQRYLRDLVRSRRASPGDNLLDALIAAEESGDRLSRDELVSNTLLLLVAGHITTTNLIGNGLLALIQHPDQLDLLRRDPGLLPAAVEELLRFESPLQFTGRVAVEEIELNGVRIQSGRALALCLGAANRDPEQFPEPDRLDIRRPVNRHLAFAAGPHFCLGAALARLESQVAIGAVVRRFPHLRLASERIEWRSAGLQRGLERLVVRLS